MSLYVFRHLVREIDSGGPLYDPAQITIEFPVPQVNLAGKSQVCKDIVVWREPGITCWDESDNPTIAPLCIMEWKFGVRAIFEPDVEWLSSFSRSHPDFIGYAVAANRPGASFLLRCARVSEGVVDRDWLSL